MTRFVVREVFTLPRLNKFVFAGDIVEGAVAAGMTARVWLDGSAFCLLRVESVEYVDRTATGDVMVGLVFREEAEQQSEFYADLCPMGTIIELTDAADAS